MSKLPITQDEQRALIAQCLELIRNGKSFTEASQELGINARTLNAWLLAILPEKYKQAQREGVVAKMLDLAENLENADSHLRVSRTRETLKFWQWIAERRLPEFAPKQEISGPGGGPIVISDNLERARRFTYLAGVIDVESSPASPTDDATPGNASEIST